MNQSTGYQPQPPSDWRERGRQNLEAARILHARGDLRAAQASSTYYALYQHVVARLIELGVEPGHLRKDLFEWEHTTVLQNVGRCFPRVDGIRARFNLRRLYRNAFNCRKIADYGPGVVQERDADDDLRELEQVLPSLGGRL